MLGAAGLAGIGGRGPTIRPARRSHLGDAALAAPLDVTLDDLRIETFLPSDDESEALLLALAGGVALEEEVGSRE